MIVPEKTTAYLTVEFFDKNGNPVTPISVTYSIYCKTSNKEVRQSTQLTPASSIEITLNSVDTAIQTQSNVYEKRIVTVIASYGVNDSSPDEFEFMVKNLTRVT